MTMLSIGLLVLAASACTKRALRYDDDVAGLQAAFDCTKSPTGDRAEGCRIISDYAAGVPLEAFPGKGFETWRAPPMIRAAPPRSTSCAPTVRG